MNSQKPDQAVRLAWRSRLSQFQFWSSSQIVNVARRPTDIFILIGTLVGFVVVTFFMPDDFLAGLQLDPGLTNIADPALLLSSIGLMVWGLFVFGMSVFSQSHRRILMQYLVAIAISVGASMIAVSRKDGGEFFQIGTIGIWEPHWSFSTVLPLGVALVSTASPFLSRRARSLGRVLITGAFFGAILLAEYLPTSASTLVLIALAAAAITHIIFGTPSGGPSPKQVKDFLDSRGLGIKDLAEDVVTPGIHRMSGRYADGSFIAVNVFAYDALDSQLWGGLTSTFRNRETKSRLVKARLDQAEHSMLMSTLAQRAGVSARSVKSLWETDRNDVLVVSDGYGETLTDISITTDVAREMWRLINALHEAGIVHSEISRRAISISNNGELAFNDLRSAYISEANSGRILDNVNVLALTAASVSVDTAISIAREFLSDDQLLEMAPYLQKAALSSSSSASKELNAKKLRERVLEVTGGEEIELARIRRVDLKSILTITIIGIITFSLYGLLSGVDLLSIFREIRNADSALILLALLLSPIIQMFFALSTVGAARRPVKYFPALMLQYAIQFIAVTMPATAARMAMNIRFFQKFGFPPAQAISIGVIDSFSGFLIQILFLLTIWIFGLTAFTVSLGSIITDSAGRDFSGLVVIVELAIILIALIFLAGAIVKRSRDFVRSMLPKIRETIRDSFENVRDSTRVLGSRRNVVMLILGNAGAQIMQAIILGVCLHIFGYSASLSQLILINTLVSLFAGLMPVPGGVGVSEAGYALCLQAIGVPPDVALVTATTFRLVTFYLPPLWGFFGFKWLRNHEYV